MGGPRSTVSKEEILSAFHTDEPFKQVAIRYGMSPNTLRKIWKEAFGEEAFTVRGKKIQATAAIATCLKMSGSRTYRDVKLTCAQCHREVTVTSRQAGQFDTSKFMCDDCKYDRACPVCGLPVDGERGLSGHFRHRREAGDIDHIKYQEDSQWEGKQENLDYVVCQICGYRAKTLASHLKPVHSMSVPEYQDKFPGALIRPTRLTEKRQEAAKNRKGGFGKGEQKTVTCPGCKTLWVVSKFLAHDTHDFRCSVCRQKAEDARWADKIESQDYVTCLECGYRAENLTSHIQNAHPGYREKYPDTLVVALGSAVRDKTALQGLVRPPEFGDKIREAKTIGLTLKDFEPYLEPDGTVDHRRMMTSLKYAYPTIKGYMDALGLTITQKYWEQAAEKRRVSLSSSDLEPYKLKNKKISIASATVGLGHCGQTVKKECHRLGLTWAHGNVSQRKCLDAISEALGNLPYIEEWKSWNFTNPLTGHRFRFDGYFPDVGLVVEFQGPQHYMFPNAFMVDESYLPVYEALLERDRIKKSLIDASPNLIYFEVREEEPYTDVMYLKGRLKQLGLDLVLRK